MPDDGKQIDQAALDSLSVAPVGDEGGDTGEGGSNQLRDPRQDAGRDASIAKRLERNPTSTEAQLDNGLDESMDASDPPSSTQPMNNNEPAASSGYDEEEERRISKEKNDG